MMQSDNIIILGEVLISMVNLLVNVSNVVIIVNHQLGNQYVLV